MARRGVVRLGEARGTAEAIPLFCFTTLPLLTSGVQWQLQSIAAGVVHMAQEKMMQARDLIKAKRYGEARVILQNIDHPKAKEWLTKLDEVELGDPFSAPAPSIKRVTVSPDVAVARTKSYTNAAVIVLVLYFVLYVPGLIANAIYYNEAKQAQELAGEALPGVGTLRLEYYLLGWVPLTIALIGVIGALIWALMVATQYR